MELCIWNVLLLQYCMGPCLYWHRINKQRSYKILEHNSRMCVVIFVLIHDLTHTWKVKNSHQNWHGDSCWEEALFVYVLPCICNLFSELIDCFFFCRTMLCHVTFNSRCNVPSLLLKLQISNHYIRCKSHVCLEHWTNQIGLYYWVVQK